MYFFLFFVYDGLIGKLNGTCAGGSPLQISYRVCYITGVALKSCVACQGFSDGARLDVQILEVSKKPGIGPNPVNYISLTTRFTGKFTALA